MKATIMRSRRLHRLLQLQVLLFYLFTVTSQQPAVTSPSPSCKRDIIDEYEARRCYQTDLAPPPLPVVLESTVENGFICKSQTSFKLYFSCNVHTSDQVIVWYFNNETVATFGTFYTVGTIFRSYYPASAPVYNITAILMEKTIQSFGEYELPLAVSILTVEPFNGSLTEAISFTVSCQARCEDENQTKVCQMNVADKPKKPSNGSGSKIQCLKSIIILNWNPPENYDRTTIDYYKVTLIGNTATSTSTTRVYVGAQADPRQSLSHILQVDSESNYTSASILAVDVCGQQSEPLEFELMISGTSNVLIPTKCTILGVLALLIILS